MIRLADIDPTALAVTVHDGVLERVLSLSQHLGAIDPAPVLAALQGPSELRLAVHQLAHYARTGEPPEGRDDLVPEYLQTLVDCDLVPDGAELAGERDPSEPLRVVVLAALARDRLAVRRSIPEGWLAALAGVATSRVRQLVAGGEMRRTAEGIHASDARRWLAGRGVPGID